MNLESEFEVAEIFCRSVTIERKGCAAYETEKPCQVFLNGKAWLSTHRTVITVDGLLPDAEYEIEIRECEEGGNVNAADGGRENEKGGNVNAADGGQESEEGGNKNPAGFVQKVRTRHESFLLSVKDFGARGDGVSPDTAAIQAAIMACPPEGTVYFPKGTYFSGPLFLKSHVSLWLDEGATLLGDPDRAHYPVLPGMIRNLYDNDKEYSVASWEGNPLDCFASLLTGIGVMDVDVFGRGVIDGNAAAGDWWEDVRNKRGAWRPRTVFFSGCKNVRMQSLTVRNSPSWTIHPYYCDHVRLLNLTIQNPEEAPNTDGVDPESCEDLMILGTRISVGDDCIAIKSGKLYMAQHHCKKTKNVVIRNCLFEKGHGSVTMGSEVAGGIEGVYVSDCIFRGTDRGVRVKTRRGRGRKALITGMTFERIRMENVQMPVTLNMFYFCDPDGHTPYVQGQDPLPVDYRTPKIGTLLLKDVECVGVDACFVCAYGLPEEPIEKIVLENVRASFLPKEERSPKRPIMMDNFEAMSGRSLFIKNVKELVCRGTCISGSEDKEPVIIACEKQDVEGLKIVP